MSWLAEQGMRKLGIRTLAAMELRPVRRHDGSYTGGSSAVETTSTIEVGSSRVIDEQLLVILAVSYLQARARTPAETARTGWRVCCIVATE